MYQKRTLRWPKIHLNVGGSFLSITKSGIEFGTSGPFKVQAATHSMTGSATRNVEMMEMPKSAAQPKAIVLASGDPAAILSPKAKSEPVVYTDRQEAIKAATNGDDVRILAEDLSKSDAQITKKEEENEAEEYYIVVSMPLAFSPELVSQWLFDSTQNYLYHLQAEHQVFIGSHGTSFGFGPDGITYKLDLKRMQKIENECTRYKTLYIDKALEIYIQKEKDKVFAEGWANHVKRLEAQGVKLNEKMKVRVRQPYCIATNNCQTFITDILTIAEELAKIDGKSLTI